MDPTLQQLIWQYFDAHASEFMEYLATKTRDASEVETVAYDPDKHSGLLASFVWQGVHKVVNVTPASLLEGISSLNAQIAQRCQTAATYATEQGDYAKTQGDYAKDKGDYAKNQGDYAKTQGDYAKTQGDNASNIYSTVSGWYTTFHDTAESWYSTFKSTAETWWETFKDNASSWYSTFKSTAETWFTSAQDAETARAGAESSRATAESARATAETARAAAETSRAAAETSRASAESSREDAESSRAAAEQGRVSAENARVTAEQGRASAENSRVTAEQGRAAAETARASWYSTFKNTVETWWQNIKPTVESWFSDIQSAYSTWFSSAQSAETARASAESSRATAETARAAAESSRETAEQGRVSAENARVTAEQGRASAESSRVTAEQARATAETDRASSFSTLMGTIHQWATGVASDWSDWFSGVQSIYSTWFSSAQSAESSRATAETARAAAETSRASAESNRDTAEQGRASAESSRVTAEQARAAAETARAAADLTRPTVTQETTWAALKALRDGGNLKPGQWYQITDFVTSIASTVTDYRSAGHAFDVIVMALTEGTLCERGFAALHAGDTYFQNSKLEAWELCYCLDNDSTRFEWADISTSEVTDEVSGETLTVPNGKGVVYWLKDQFGNEIPYDFKNIQFMRRPLSGRTGLVMPAACCAAETYDAEAVKAIGTIYDQLGNSMSATNYGYWHSLGIGNAVLGSTLTGDFVDSSLQAAVIDQEAYYVPMCTVNSKTIYCKIVAAVYLYTFHYRNGANSDDRSLTDNVVNLNVIRPYYNSGKQTLNNIVFCIYNTSNRDVRANSFGFNCYNNTFSQRTYENTFGNNCYQNTFGNNMQYNTFGNYVYYNTFGNGVCYILFGESAQVLGAYFYNNIIENGNQYIRISTSATTSSTLPYRNVTIAQGVNNSDVWKVIESDETGQEFKTVYQDYRSKTINIGEPEPEPEPEPEGGENGGGE